MCRSVPQMPACVTATSTSRGPIFGTGVSCCHQRPGSLSSLRLAGMVEGISRDINWFLEIGISVWYSRISESCLQEVNSSIVEINIFGKFGNEMATKLKKAKSVQVGSHLHAPA